MLTSALLMAVLAPQSVTIPVVVVSYFPVDGDKIDIKVTGDWGDTYAATKAKTGRLTEEACEALGRATRFRGYKNPAAAQALEYKVIGQFEFKEPLPTVPKRGNEAPMTDYNAIMGRIDAAKWVKEQGVKEIWVWGYHGGKVGLWESNMSSPTGDVSNSNRDGKDLPVFDRTYTVYHYNYQRGLGEMLENHMHQLEHLLNFVDGRDVTPPAKWPELLFWGKFVGSDASHKLVGDVKRCGWTHYAPNSERDYDWQNPRYVETDIEDWRPDGIGKTQRMNAERWNNDPIQWRIYWMQAIPGVDNGLTYKGRKLRNWWSFVSDWDRARREKWTLME